MKVKGFTLVELLGVIIILGFLALLIIPTVDKAIKANNTNLYNSQIATIRLAAESWGSENFTNLPTVADTSINITLGYLKQEGYIALDLRDPITKKLFSDSETIITITKKVDNWEYTVSNVEVED